MEDFGSGLNYNRKKWNKLLDEVMFSCRLYGLRKYKNQIKEDEGIAKELQNGNKSNTRTNAKNK